MTPVAIVYNLNVIDLKLSEIVKHIDNVPDSELSDNYLQRYNGYLYSIIDKARKLLKCPAAELGKNKKL